jgi:DNA-binding CsgD family transcriptional regulator
MPGIPGMKMRNRPNYIPGRKQSREYMNSPRLTERQLQVLVLICEGKSAREISKILGIAHTTVKRRREHLQERLGVNKCALMVRWAIRNEIIAP